MKVFLFFIQGAGRVFFYMFECNIYFFVFLFYHPWLLVFVQYSNHACLGNCKNIPFE